MPIQYQQSVEITGRYVECDCGQLAVQRSASLVYRCPCGARYGAVAGGIIRLRDRA